jgi:hypothetical protein
MNIVSFNNPAVRDGLEPSSGDSIDNINACMLVVIPILSIYFFIHARETIGCVGQFRHLTILNSIKCNIILKPYMFII